LVYEFALESANFHNEEGGFETGPYQIFVLFSRSPNFSASLVSFRGRSMLRPYILRTSRFFDFAQDMPLRIIDPNL
jgi:hypothetical protein